MQQRRPLQANFNHCWSFWKGWLGRGGGKQEILRYVAPLLTCLLHAFFIQEISWAVKFMIFTLKISNERPVLSKKTKKKVYAVFQSAQCCLWFIVAVMSIQLSNKRLWEALAWFRRLVFVSSHSTFTKPPWDINSNFYFKILASIWRHFSYKDRIIYEALFHVALMLLKYGELGSNQEIVFSLHTESKTKKTLLILGAGEIIKEWSRLSYIWPPLVWSLALHIIPWAPLLSTEPRIPIESRVPIRMAQTLQKYVCLGLAQWHTR